MELQDYLPFNNGSQTGFYSFFGLIFFTLVAITSLKAQDSVPKVLVVIAHPDDESVMAATIYKITHELSGIVDLAIITNGEGGFRYSLLSETIYDNAITKEHIGRKELPQIR
jgi:LmbE family N-acetylglucosaminyl deacetylase